MKLVRIRTIISKADVSGAMVQIANRNDIDSYTLFLKREIIPTALLSLFIFSSRHPITRSTTKF